MNYWSERDSIAELGAKERTAYFVSAKASIYDKNKHPLFDLSFLAGRYLSSSFDFVEDAQGNIIVLQQDGIASYDLTGKQNWLFTEGIRVNKDSLFDTTNVFDLYLDKDNHIMVKTDHFVLTLGSDGEVLNSRSYKPLNYEYSENSFLDLETNDEGLAWYEGRYISPKQVADLYLKQVDTESSVLPVVRWAKGSYTIDKDAALISRDQNGKVKWKYKKFAYGNPENIVADASGNVFFSDGPGNIYGLNEKGNEKFILKRNIGENGTITYLTLNKQGDLLGVTSGIGMFCISKRHENIVINGKPIELEAKPVVKNGTFLIPYRSLFNQLGISTSLDSSKKWTIARTKEGRTLKFQTGNLQVQINGKTTKLNAAPQKIGSTDYIPATSLAGLLGTRMEWDKLRNEVHLGQDSKLAEEAVRRFLLEVEHGEELLANDLLSVPGKDFASRAPGLKKEHETEKWVIDIRGVKTTKISNSEYRVEVSQHNQKFFHEEGPVADEDQTFTYQVKLAADGRWKISSSNFLK